MAQGPEAPNAGAANDDAPERYPPVRQDDSVELPGEASGGAVFDPDADAPTPPGPGDQDPVEGKRD
ncbi:MAG TPA: hypothetical protein VGC92_01275 [Phenylobacterium sp.]|jgi:hypothetical protein